MAYIANNPAGYDKQVVGNGHCVVFVQTCTCAPQARMWKEGAKVKGALTLQTGTAIATFKNGVYPNNASGNHAAIYMSQDAMGIWVYDQWIGQPVHKRLIRFKGGVGSAVDDGDAYSVIE